MKQDCQIVIFSNVSLRHHLKTESLPMDVLMNLGMCQWSMPLDFYPRDPVEYNIGSWSNPDGVMVGGGKEAEDNEDGGGSGVGGGGRGGGGVRGGVHHHPLPPKPLRTGGPHSICSSEILSNNSTVVYIITTTWMRFFFEFYLHLRQRRFIERVEEVPEPLKQFYSVEVFEKVKNACIFSSVIYINRLFYKAILITVIFAMNLYCRAWYLACMVAEDEYYKVMMFNSFMAVIQLAVMKVITFMFEILRLKEPDDPQSTFNILTLKKLTSLGYAVLMSQMTWSWWRGTGISLLVTALSKRGTHYPLIGYLIYRVYVDYIAPNALESKLANYRELDTGQLKKAIQNVTIQMDFPVEKIYINMSSKGNWHGAKVRGLGGKKQLVLSWRLVEGHTANVQMTLRTFWPWCKAAPRYTEDEVVAIVARAIVKYKTTNPGDEAIVETTRWPRILTFTLMLSTLRGTYAKFGFKQEAPPYVGFLLSSYLAHPIIFALQIVRYRMYRLRCKMYDEQVEKIGLGLELASFLAKESVTMARCPIEDPLFNSVYSVRPTLYERFNLIALQSG